MVSENVFMNRISTQYNEYQSNINTLINDAFDRNRILLCFTEYNLMNISSILQLLRCEMIFKVEI